MSTQTTTTATAHSATTAPKTVHAYSHRASKVTVKHVAPKHHTLSPQQRLNLLYSQDEM